MVILFCFAFGIAIVGAIYADLRYKIFTYKAISGLFLVVVPHIVLLFYRLGQFLSEEKISRLWQGFIFAELVLILAYFWVKVNFFPLHIKQEVSVRAKIIIGGRRLVFYGLFVSIIQIFIYIYGVRLTVWFQLPNKMFVTDWVVTCVAMLTLLLNGGLRIFFASTRLRILRRLIVMSLIWIPVLNVFVLLYLCHIANLEFDHACYKVVNRQARIDSDVCKTKYPLMMLHGVGFRDLKYINYWGRIPKELMRNGATIYYGNQEAWGTIANNAEDIKQKINEVLKETGCAKVNIIAHSKGGLDARYAISMLGIGDAVASLTTMSTPHRGCKMADLGACLPEKIYRFLARLIDKYFRVIGDKNPDFYTACNQFSNRFSQTFNEQVKDVQSVYYQSYCSVMKHRFSDLLLTLPYSLIKILEGENDGLVTIDSAKWGDFKGVLRNKHSRGISHGDIIDLKRDDYKGFDVVEKYVEIVSELKTMGF